MFIEDRAYIYPRLLKDLQEVLDENGSCHISFGIMEMKPLCGRQRFSLSREVRLHYKQPQKLKILRKPYFYLNVCMLKTIHTLPTL